MHRISQLICRGCIRTVVLHGHIVDEKRRIALISGLLVFRDHFVYIRIIRHSSPDSGRTFEFVKKDLLVESEEPVDIVSVIAGGQVRMHADGMPVSINFQSRIQVWHIIFNIQLIGRGRRRQETDTVSCQHFILRIGCTAAVRGNIQFAAYGILLQSGEIRAYLLIGLKIHPGLHIRKSLVHNDQNIWLQAVFPFRCFFRVPGCDLLHRLPAVILGYLDDHKLYAAKERQDGSVVSVTLLRPEGVQRHMRVPQHARMKIRLVEQERAGNRQDDTRAPDLPSCKDPAEPGPEKDITPCHREQSLQETVIIQ